MDTTTSALRFGRAIPTKMSVSLVDFGTVGGDQYRAPSGFTTRKSPRSDSNLPVIRSGNVLQPDAKSIRPVRRTVVICSTLMVVGDVVVFTVCLRMETQYWRAEACALGFYRLGASASCRHLEIGCLGKSPKAVEGHRAPKTPIPLKIWSVGYQRHGAHCASGLGTWGPRPKPTRLRWPRRETRGHLGVVSSRSFLRRRHPWPRWVA